MVRLRKLCLFSSENRRFIAVFFYNAINDNIRLALDSRVCFSKDADWGYALRSKDTPNLLPCHSRTNLLKFSFMDRIVEEWNRLPPDIRQASSVVGFKSKVFKFLVHTLIFVLILLNFFVYTFKLIR